jgi:opacity protein-like surface antigen
MRLNNNSMETFVRSLRRKQIMKIHIPVCVALAIAFISTTAYGQYVQQPRRAVAPQQNWTVPVVRAASMQEPALQVQSNAAPATTGAYMPAVADGCGCGTDCGNQPGRGGRLGSRLQGLGGQANDGCGPKRYLSIFGGASTFNDIYFNNVDRDIAGAVLADNSILLEENNGWTIGGGIGQRLTRRIRGEIEWSYRNASLEQASGPIIANALDGQLNAYRSTSNLFFDFNPDGRFNLYCGGGVGVGFVDIDATDPAVPLSTRLKSSSFVYQGVAGMSAKIRPQVELFADYRFTGTSQLEIDTITPLGTSDIDVDISSNDIFFGLRFWR